MTAKSASMTGLIRGIGTDIRTQTEELCMHVDFGVPHDPHDQASDFTRGALSDFRLAICDCSGSCDCPDLCITTCIRQQVSSAGYGAQTFAVWEQVRRLPSLLALLKSILSDFYTFRETSRNKS